jgi:SAM-dependent MidA family methyltransferase
MVERAAPLRAAQRELLTVEPFEHALGPSRPGRDDGTPQPVGGSGPIVSALDELPALTVDGVILANELLDNLPFDLTLEGAPFDPQGEWPETGLAPEQGRARAWVDRVLGRLRGRLLVLDYCSTTAAMAGRPWREWLRTYRGHGRGSHPMDDLGHQDITAEVAVDQLPPPDDDTSQADWLRRWGIEELVEEGRRTWAERAHLADLEAVKARSRVNEAEALLDPRGMGAFRVLEWSRS